jgi:hypothetical protein
VTEFKVGDEVTINTRSGARAVVEYGPYGTNGDVYLVKLLEGDDAGDVFPALAYILKTAPVVFKPGDKVRCGVLEYEVKHGPLTGYGPWYVVTDGVRDLRAEGDGLALIERAPVSGYEYGGVVYEFGRWYVDVDGDKWRFEAPVTLGDMPQASEGSYESGRTLGSVVRSHGPLK